VFTKAGGAQVTWREVSSFVLIVMIVFSIAMAVAAAERCPGFFLQPGARLYLFEPMVMLIGYAGAIVVIVANRGAEWDVELRNAAIFGVMAGLCEAAFLALENGLASATSGPAVQVAGMIVVFALWSVAAAKTGRELKRFGPG
jgi:hypothetical protein